ncbi:PP2C family protein-serine/threonine phosphatase [Enterobacter hormaechei]|uniref:PP2C family protein-serine/threonine phosphatase n=1 Tax=Enterobacter hormaechei TaxID=158836 RepID=UPI00125A2F40|nr:PP2C family serine/threonine-protein phosphatase [Enterobacter hormaechei]MDX6967942.1 PP2C family serine/threonine-protein phosphatase [Enterobacter hormaechei]VAF36677.1 Serine/threonine phosphatase stp [Enterobacter hormaechei]
MLKIKELASFCLAQPEKLINEDAFFLPFIHRNGSILFAVADGVGSYEGANNASTIALECLSNELEKNEFSIRNVFDATKLKLSELSDSYSQLSKAATTLSIVAVTNNKIEITHIGDSRIYYKDANNKLKQLTQDHTKYQELLDSREFSLRRLKEHKERLSRVLTQAITKDHDLKYDFYTLDLDDIPKHNGCIFLYAMTDGAYHFWEKRPNFSDKTMSSPVSYVSSLKKRIEKIGAEDDYTLIALSISV